MAERKKESNSKTERVENEGEACERETNTQKERVRNTHTDRDGMCKPQQ